jgi:hypothetical protein
LGGGGSSPPAEEVVVGGRGGGGVVPVGGGGVAAAGGAVGADGCVRTGGLAVDARIAGAGGVANCEAKDPLAAVLGEAVCARGGGTTGAGGGVSDPACG